MRATSLSDAEAPSSCTLARRPCCDGELRRRTAVVEVLDARRLTGKAPSACAGGSGKGGRGETVVGTATSAEFGAGSDRDALEEAMECDVVIELSKKNGMLGATSARDASHGVKYRRCAFPIRQAHGCLTVREACVGNPFGLIENTQWARATPRRSIDALTHSQLRPDGEPARDASSRGHGKLRVCTQLNTLTPRA